MDKKDESEFRVVDKRRFTEEGDSKGGAEEKASFEESKVISSEALKESAPETPRGDASAPGEEPELSFASFVVSLATQALSLLGEIPNPMTQQTEINLDAARQTIDILGLLETKTQGNLTPEEENLLEEILSSLRMAYVRCVKEKKQ